MCDGSNKSMSAKTCKFLGGSDRELIKSTDYSFVHD